MFGFASANWYVHGCAFNYEKPASSRSAAGVIDKPSFIIFLTPVHKCANSWESGSWSTLDPDFP